MLSTAIGDLMLRKVLSKPLLYLQNTVTSVVLRSVTRLTLLAGFAKPSLPANRTENVAMVVYLTKSFILLTLGQFVPLLGCPD